VHASDHGGLLRARDGGEERVTPLELFFDLVYVFAVTQLSHRLLEHLTLVGALETLFLLLVVWWAWMYTTWFTNWFDPARPPVRALLVAIMLASLFMSVAIPDAFGKRGLMFAIACVTMQVGRTTFADLEVSLDKVAAFVVAFVGSAAFWWLYFSRHAEVARETISSSEDPGRLARSAYTYFHLPMIAGIIVVAASDELNVAHPGEHGTLAFMTLVLGGTGLFLAGQAFFKWAIAGLLPWSPWSRVVAIAALAALVPVGSAVPALALSAAAALIVVALAAWDTVADRQRARSPKRSPT
jgi:low temperature requirement protein LtrA